MGNLDSRETQNPTFSHESESSAILFFWFSLQFGRMGKKRKAQQVVAPPTKPVVPEAEPPRKRTLLGLKPEPQPEAEAEVEANGTTTAIEEVAPKAPVPFRNKEKTLVLCSRRITFRYELASQALVAITRALSSKA